MTLNRKQRFQNDRLARDSRRPLFSIFAALAVILVAIMASGILYWHALAEAERDRDQSRADSNLWELAKTNTALRLWDIAKLVSADDRVLPLFAAGTRDRLAAIITPWFQALHNNQQLTKLDFLQADRRVFLRAEDARVFGDGVDSAPLLAAGQRREAVSGLAVGPAGVAFELVIPLLQGDTITGYLDLAGDIRALLGDLRKAAQADVLLVLNNKLAEGAVVAQSSPGLTDGFQPAVTGSGQPADVLIQKGHRWRVVSVPVADAAGQPIGRVDTIRDDAERHWVSWIALATFLGAVLAVAGLAVAICHLFLYRIQPAMGLTSRQRQDLELMSMRDGLTGLYNRGAIGTLLTKELAHVREVGLPLSVMIVALDEYQVFNNVTDRGIDDKVVVAVADSLQHQLRLGDLAVRNTGDSFILIVQRVGGMLAKDVAERLRRAIAGTRVETASGLLPISACIGVSCYPESGAASADLIAAAEQALTVAKGQGRNQIRMAEA